MPTLRRPFSRYLRASHHDRHPDVPEPRGPRRGPRRYVEDLLRGRRPRPFRPSAAEVTEVRMAIRLRAARPSADVPREQFVAELHRRLDAELRESGEVLDGGVVDQAVPHATVGAADGAGWGRRSRRAAWPSSRRRVIGAVSAVFAGVAAGVGVGRALLSPDEGGGRGGGSTDGTVALAAASLRPAQGTWRTVAASADLPEGAVQPFDLQTVTGFVMRRQGALQALCGVCTHQGCRLQLNRTAARLDCPCHNAAFSLTGTLLPGFGGYHALPPLPELSVREHDGDVQIFAPAEASSGGRTHATTPTAQPTDDDDGSYSGATSPSR